MDIPTDKKIIDIIDELKARNLIDPHRSLKESKNIPGAFKASVFTRNTITYNPNFLEGFNDDIIRFCLLHEEGHLRRGQYGVPALLFLIGLGLVPLFFCILSGQGTEFFIIISLCFFLFVFFSSIRILTEPFYWDEYGSDEFASKILQDNYGIKEPSKIVNDVLDGIPSSFDSCKLLHRLFLAFFEYHPSMEQRVRNIVESIDEK
jgi:Zn-dependent protease with chaperone function